MKIRIITSVIAVLLLFIAEKSSAQCPPFTRAVIVYEIDQFNFHRPKFDCERGFFICIRGHWELKCVPSSPLSARITEDGMVQGYALLIDGKVELHLPAELTKLPKYAREDMSIFSVEKDWISIFFEEKKIGTLKEGEYTVETIEKELVITIDLE